MRRRVLWRPGRCTASRTMPTPDMIGSNGINMPAMMPPAFEP